MQASSKVRCIDRAGLGMKAFQLTLPGGWVFFGGMEWSHDPAFAVHANFAAVSADGRCAVQFFPDHAAAWTGDEDARRSMPSTMFVRVATPPTPQQALKEWIVEPARKAVGPVEVLKEEDLSGPGIPELPPDVVDTWSVNVPAMPKMGRVRIRYSLQGTPMEEEFWGQLTVNSIPAGAGGMPFPYTYSVLNTVISYRAPAGEMDTRLSTLFGIQGSYRPNQEYFEQLRRLFGPDSTAVQGGQDPARAQAVIQQHQMTVMRMVAEYSTRWTTIVQVARQEAAAAGTPLSPVAETLGYPPEGRLLGTVAAPDPAPAAASTPVPVPVGQVPRPAPPAPPASGGGFCTSCGAPLPAGANFCPACGARVAHPPARAPPPSHPTPGHQGQPRTDGAPEGLPIICPRCKAPMPPGSQTCVSCGSPL